MTRLNFFVNLQLINLFVGVTVQLSVFIAAEAAYLTMTTLYQKQTHGKLRKQSRLTESPFESKLWAVLRFYIAFFLA